MAPGTGEAPFSDEGKDGNVTLTGGAATDVVRGSAEVNFVLTRELTDEGTDALIGINAALLTGG